MLVPGRLGQLGEVGGAEEPLLLAGHGHEDDRRVELPGGHHPRQLEHGGHARCVVVGSGRITYGVERVAAARVVVTADHVDAVGGLGLAAVERCDDVRDRRRLWNPRRRSLDVALQLHGHPPVRRRGRALELAEKPVARGPYPPLGVSLRRQGVAGAEARQLADAALDPVWADLARHPDQLRRWRSFRVSRVVRLRGGDALGCGGQHSQKYEHESQRTVPGHGGLPCRYDMGIARGRPERNEAPRKAPRSYVQSPSGPPETGSRLAASSTRRSSTGGLDSHSTSSRVLGCLNMSRAA